MNPKQRSLYKDVMLENYSNNLASVGRRALWLRLGAGSACLKSELYKHLLGVEHICFWAAFHFWDHIILCEPGLG